MDNKLGRWRERGEGKGGRLVPHAALSSYWVCLLNTQSRAAAGCTGNRILTVRVYSPWQPGHVTEVCLQAVHSTRQCRKSFSAPNYTDLLPFFWGGGGVLNWNASAVTVLKRFLFLWELQDFIVNSKFQSFQLYFTGLSCILHKHPAGFVLQFLKRWFFTSNCLKYFFFPLPAYQITS